MSNYSDKLGYVQAVTNCRYSIAQMCIWEDYSPCLLRLAFSDDVTGQSELTTIVYIVNNQILKFVSLILQAGSEWCNSE